MDGCCCILGLAGRTWKVELKNLIRWRPLKALPKKNNNNKFFSQPVPSGDVKNCVILVNIASAVGGGGEETGR
jgi:hypothetical protein